MTRSAALIVLLAAACGPEPPRRAALSVQGVLSAAPEEGFERAMAPRAFDFPADHGPHRGFRNEWWYFTGNLSDAGGRRFGYQLTFFRNALASDAPQSPSAWAASEVWMAHFAISDVEALRFHAFERFERGSLGLAGAQASPLRVWTGAWSAESATQETFPLRLRAKSGDVKIDLVLEPAKDAVSHGDGGVSQKGSQPGNASHYYSYTRLTTRGTLRTPAGTISVSGNSWLDREWSTSALEKGQVGWDWFALHLDDGRDLMLFQIRAADARPTPQSAGTLVDRGGQTQRLMQKDFALEVRDTWRSPRSRATYPSRWRLRVPSAGLDLDVRPALADQELDLAFRYWEGAVTASGNGVEGRGYVELTGYVDAP